MAGASRGWGHHSTLRKFRPVSHFGPTHPSFWFEICFLLLESLFRQTLPLKMSMDGQRCTGPLPTGKKRWWSSCYGLKLTPTLSTTTAGLRHGGPSSEATMYWRKGCWRLKPSPEQEVSTLSTVLDVLGCCCCCSAFLCFGGMF